MNKAKIKGDTFERLVVKLFNEHIKNSEWQRVIGSGAFGTLVSEPILMADIRGKIDSLPKKLKGEAKVGYSNRTEGEAKSFTLKKKWLDKIREEADNDYSYPFLVGKFDNVKEGTKIFVVLDVDFFVELMNYITDLKEELDGKG